ncbi:MAG: hypothetical protein HN345_05230 [Planctomycetaceae bacterium]|nr:hypothetical protein [Planctomycetaceae bacterium]
MSEFDGTPDHVFVDGDILPGDVKAFWIGAPNHGEMVLHWKSQMGNQMLICGDAIYGQSSSGSFDGGPENFWHQTEGIRLYCQGRVEEAEMRGRYDCLLDLDFKSILNGHNPKSIDQDPKGALLRVLREGVYERHPNGSTYLWLDLSQGQGIFSSS